MASIPVNNDLNVLATIVNQAVNAANSSARQEDASKDSFGMVMNRVNAQTGAQANSRTDVKVTASVDTKAMTANIVTAGAGQNVVKSDTQTGTKQSVESSSNAAQNPAGQTVSDDQKDAVTNAGEKLVEDVAEEMDVTPEEVEEVMEVLGLTAIQLLDPANMQKLLIALSGNEDQLSILTDGDLYGHLQNLLGDVMSSLENLQDELGLSTEELNALIADMAVLEKQPETEIPEEILANAETEDVNLEGIKDYAVTVHKDGETVEVKVTVDDASGNQSTQEEVTSVSEVQTKHEAKSGKNSSGESKGEGQSGNLMMQTPVEQPNLNEVPVQEPVMERFVSTEDIMNQIMEYMKINLKGDVQELELQLHPASLGNVNVQISSKDGMITAQFTTQNEVVKAAIESQLVQLKTQFEEQGIKVDAVEVAVADYRFEQNFSGNEEHAGEKQGSGKKSQRRINLNDMDLDEMPEDMDDSDRIAADMMARSGNSVDYTA